MVSPKITIENEYASLLFSIDGLEHPLLRGIPYVLAPGMRDYEISRVEFVDLRFQILNGDLMSLGHQAELTEIKCRNLCELVDLDLRRSGEA
jgi:hypothetical protein